MYTSHQHGYSLPARGTTDLASSQLEYGDEVSKCAANSFEPALRPVDSCERERQGAELGPSAGRAQNARTTCREATAGANSECICTTYWRGSRSRPSPLGASRVVRKLQRNLSEASDSRVNSLNRRWTLPALTAREVFLPCRELARWVTPAPSRASQKTPFDRCNAHLQSPSTAREGSPTTGKTQDTGKNSAVGEDGCKAESLTRSGPHPRDLNEDRSCGGGEHTQRSKEVCKFCAKRLRVSASKSRSGSAPRCREHGEDTHSVDGARIQTSRETVRD
ncbi:hypothetical protein EXIGLDRAFT_691413 [Exidia glandulosa HHB12029]|uniref:Uncharacterized protein n=1 Tax=Exidia glandulosa HHB12029 TaxID=1314781 RepID=A0A165IN97_EXIGL|nr:hypothetical protein EXIGLDRAFT_691413 [Exidia glandulosa HHB12029]